MQNITKSIHHCLLLGDDTKEKDLIEMLSCLPTSRTRWFVVTSCDVFQKTQNLWFSDKHGRSNIKGNKKKSFVVSVVIKFSFSSSIMWNKFNKINLPFQSTLRINKKKIVGVNFENLTTASTDYILLVEPY